MSGRLDKPLIRLHCCGFVFTPKLIPTLAVLLLLPFFIYLGNWQLQRAAYKKSIQVRVHSHQQQAPISITMLTRVKDPEYRMVKLTGHYDNQHVLLLDNRVLQHQVGYEVLTPFQLSGDNKREVLINRGWIPRGNSRAQLPFIKGTFGEQTIVGMVKYPPEKPFVLAHEVEALQWPWRIQAIYLDKIQQTLHRPFYPFMVLLSPNATGGFKRLWTGINLDTKKHYGYAFQWFALALTLVIIYLALNIHRGNYESTRKD